MALPGPDTRRGARLEVRQRLGPRCFRRTWKRLQRCLGSSWGAWQPPPPPGPGSPRPPRTPCALGAWHCQETLGGGRGGRSPLFAFLLPPHDSRRQRLVSISGCSLGASAWSSPAHTAPARQEEQQQQQHPHQGWILPPSAPPCPTHVLGTQQPPPPATGMGGTAPPSPKWGGAAAPPAPWQGWWRSTHGPRPLSKAFCSCKAPQTATFLHPQLPSFEMS